MAMNYRINRQMEKTAMPSVRTEKIFDFVKKHPYLVFGGISGLLGATGGVFKARKEIKDDLIRKKKKSLFHVNMDQHKKEKAIVYGKNIGLNAASGIISGLVAGHQFNTIFGPSGYGQWQSNQEGQSDFHGYQRQQYNWEGAYRPSTGPLINDALKTMGINKGNFKTKKAVNDLYREMARKSHPDIGGDADEMKKINIAMGIIRESGWYGKLAFGYGYFRVSRCIEKTAGEPNGTCKS